MLFAASTLIAALAIAPAVNAVPRRRASEPKPMLAPQNIPSVWQKANTQPSGSDPLSFTLVLTSAQDPKALETKMTEISMNPDMDWLTQDELREYVKASDDAKSQVEDAIKTMDGATFTYSALEDKVTVVTTVDQASKFFDTTFDHYTYNGPVASNAIKTTQYTIPASVSDIVSDVFPIASFSAVKALKARLSERTIEARQDDNNQLASTPSSCNTDLVTSPCIRSLYGYDSYSPVGTQEAVGIMGFIEQNYSPTDLATYLKAYRPDASGYTIAVNTSDGANNNPSQPGVEAALDTQTIAGIIYPLASTFYDIGNKETQGDIFLIAFQEFLDKGSFPAVSSFSYGSSENGVTQDQANTMCNAAQQLTAMGMTIVASSGDSGVDGQGQGQGGDCPPFIPTYPSGCPYILSVGATQSFSPEVMVDTNLAGFYSGAGFSNLFPTPDYQQSAVAAYLSGAGSSQTSNFNNSGRAYPDVSAQGSKQAVVASGKTEAVGGTSASAPIVASGIALLNDLLLAAGKSTAGWMHPMIYSSSGAFTDVTDGGSFGCSDPSAGLSAAAGWDASSGLGTPIFSGLRSLYGV